jgi:hypothetical protein
MIIQINILPARNNFRIFILFFQKRKTPFLYLQERGFENLRTIHSLRTEAIGEQNSMRMIARGGKEVKVQSFLGEQGALKGLEVSAEPESRVWGGEKWG